VTPGPHEFELRVGQGGGGVGQAPNKTVPGAGFDRLGRSNGYLCVPIVDPGDGSLLTLFADPYAVDSLPKNSGKLADASTLELAADGLLDLGTTAQTLAGVTGIGTISNGALTVTGWISPAGTNAVGTLTAKANTTLTGTLVVDIATNRTSNCDRLVVEGQLTLTAATLEIRNPEALSTLMVYTLATYPETAEVPEQFILPPELVNSLWAVRHTTTKIQLYCQGGTLILFN
jgi:hypothetical protein